MPEPSPYIEAVRSFNRFYTRRIGLLREGLLQTPFSLTQARVLYELGTRPVVRSADLAAELGLDPGYLSRLFKNFAGRGLIRRSASASDRRAHYLSLTARGKTAFNRLNTRSQSDVQAMLTGMSSMEHERLVDAMGSIRSLLGKTVEQSGQLVIRPHQSGDIGWVVARHGEIYAQEYGWDTSFEGLVAQIAGRFLTGYDPELERCWIAEQHGRRLGSVFLVRESKSIAKLRLLLVEPFARGLGVGTKLVDECLAFARRIGYRKVTLWTNDGLRAARRLYERAGFRLVREEKHRSFGHDLTGQFWELSLKNKPATT